MDAIQNRTAFPPPPKGGGFHAEDTVNVPSMTESTTVVAAVAMARCAAWYACKAASARSAFSANVGIVVILSLRVAATGRTIDVVAPHFVVG
jgi:hypothetical protein